ncbi:hypothetical protein BDD12DRAFT_904235 [Trichophaea hybrida]|nr:hypothetical protein BDD12DRAFT_904235 [Trichophaea hybrida]
MSLNSNVCDTPFPAKPLADHQQKKAFQHPGIGYINGFPVVQCWSEELQAYGDCCETLPLAIAASISSKIGPETEVRSMAAFTSELCHIGSITDDGKPDLSINLKQPCKKCKGLMERIPGSATMLAGSGTSQDVHWVTEKRGDVDNSLIRYVSLGYSRFSYSAAYAANEEMIYEMIKIWTIGSVGVFVRADIRENLATMWDEFIIPYRMKNTIFRLNTSGEVDPIMLHINDTSVPICTVFCALAYILSNVLEPSWGYRQSISDFIPLMAILAKWCETLCPWGRPDVISIVGITSRTPEGMARFLLGTTKPYLKLSQKHRSIRNQYRQGMKLCRLELLEKVFGWLPDHRP